MTTLNSSASSVCSPSHWSSSVGCNLEPTTVECSELILRIIWNPWNTQKAYHTFVSRGETNLFLTSWRSCLFVVLSTLSLFLIWSHGHRPKDKVHLWLTPLASSIQYLPRPWPHNAAVWELESHWDQQSEYCPFVRPRKCCVFKAGYKLYEISLQSKHEDDFSSFYSVKALQACDDTEGRWLKVNRLLRRED